jgi:hypothetical protein
MIARHQRVVFVDFSVTFLPVIKLARTDPHPFDNLAGGDFGTVIPIADVVDHLVANIVGNPLPV